MKNLLIELHRLHAKAKELEIELGIDKMSATERKIMGFIATHGEGSIHVFEHNSLFSNTSLSTLKRAVLHLVKAGLITSERSKEDARIKSLKLTNG